MSDEYTKGGHEERRRKLSTELSQIFLKYKGKKLFIPNYLLYIQRQYGLGEQAFNSIIKQYINAGLVRIEDKFLVISANYQEPDGVTISE